MGFNCGIVGLPNVGKSTLFNALTAADIDAQNYPFCTIDPNIGVVAVPDKRLDEIARIVKPKKIIPTSMEFVDIAGLVAGASKGDGLGNKFLANIRETDAIAHVVRCFADDNVVHVDGGVDPLRDVEVINTELALADLQTVEKAGAKAVRQTRAGDKHAAKLSLVLDKLSCWLDKANPARTLGLSPDELMLVTEYHLLTLKPVMYIANVNEDEFTDNEYLTGVENLATTEHAPLVVVCAALESELSQMEDEEKQEFLSEPGFKEPGLNRVISAGYELLGLHTFFTAGKNEGRAWTIPVNTTASQAAAKIHTDFERGFIRAEVISYDDFIRYQGEAGAKEAGKLRLEGRDYLVQDGDVMHFRFNV